MENIKNEPAYSKSVLEFITVANDFCIFMEKVASYNETDVFNYLQKVSPLLYLKASLLPDVHVEDPSANERFVTLEQYEDIFNALRSKILDHDVFWYIDLDSPDENLPVKGSIAESYADSYQDLKDFLLLYQKNTRVAKQNAVFECKNLFKEHWSYRLLNAMKAIHHILYKDFSDNKGQEYI